MSSTSPPRSMACWARNAAIIAGLANAASVAGVWVMPGCTLLTRMPYCPSSSAATRTRWSTAALPAQYDAR